MLTGSIAFYCRSLCFGGIERNIIRIIQDCKSSGIRTILITSKNTPISKVIPNGGIEIITTKTEGKRLGLRSIWQLAKILDEKETKALIITKPIEIFTGALIKIISGFKIKIIYYQHVGLNFKNGWFLYSLLFKWVDKWITPVNYIRKQALEQR